MYSIYGLTYEVFIALHDFYLPHTIITSSERSTINQGYNITISDNAILKFNNGNITVDLAGKLFTIEHDDYIRAVIL